jgi:glyoxylase-like metal-dependent hydrolase (beta-lactamase superfamily II)
MEREKVMGNDTHTLRVGSARVTVFNVGDLGVAPAEWFTKQRQEWAPRYGNVLERRTQVPVYCAHIAMGDLSLVVDAGRFDVTQDSSYFVPGYQPPPDLLTRLAEIGVRPEDVTHVVITHGHGDHYNGVTVERDGAYAPCFPNARHYIGRADWEREEAQTALRDPSSEVSHTLGVLHNAGLLELVEGNRDLGHGVRITATPGETPGHQIVGVTSGGETLYCLGDLFHHPIEVENLAWMVDWATPETNLPSRQALIEDALAEDALFVATHINEIGRLQRTPDGIAWTSINAE